MGPRIVSVAMLCAAAAGIFGAGTAYADTVAVTGGATQLTSSSARLNGVGNPSTADAAWFFQYAGAGKYHQTKVTAFKAAGAQAVSIEVSGLAPHTTYAFRLVVEQSTTESAKFSAGSPLSFTTPSSSVVPPGKKKRHAVAALRSHRLIVSPAGIVSIPFKCAGTPGTACRGIVSLTARGKRGKRVSCGRKALSAKAGSSHPLKLAVGKGCQSLLRTARKHTLSATLRAKFSSGQAALSTTVTLVE